MKRRILIAVVLGALSGLAARALVAPTPSRTIRILVPAFDQNPRTVPNAAPADALD
ncbi:MAG: hypothetical protein HYR85_27765 [Planctomycetes bacterium]|nr:hypothetical protein [Planctomycetota bacterium]MBI3844221.1 hypothetical protein [Planctomycetota bacterium]